MKILYIFLNLIFVLALVVFAVSHYTYKSPASDKALSATPVSADAKLETARAKDRVELPVLTSLWEKNLFEPERGISKSDNISSAPVDNMEMELVGICRYGETAGAIILCKNKGGGAAPPAAHNPQGNVAGNTKSRNSSPKSEKRFFKIGERLNNGFSLEKINNDSVILARGNEEIVLKMEFGDNSSTKRVASVNIKPPVPPTPAAQPGSQDPSKNDTTKLPKPPKPPPMMKSAQNSMIFNSKTINEYNLQTS